MIRENKGIFEIASLASLSLGLLAMTFSLVCGSSWAALDIFDTPKSVEQKKESVKKQDEMKFLDYPKDCFLKGDYKEAVNSCHKLLDDPYASKLKGDISYLLGLNLLKLERFLEARSYFNDVLLAEKEKGDLKRGALLGIGDSYFLEGSYDKACDTYNKILVRYPQSQIAPIVYYHLGQALSRMDRAQEAKYYLDKVPREFPFSFEARLAADVNGDYYSVQLGCFNKKDNADQVCEKLVREGFDAYVLDSGDNTDGPRFRVKAGRFHSKEESQELEKRLKRAGYSTKICP